MSQTERRTILYKQILTNIQNNCAIFNFATYIWLYLITIDIIYDTFFQVDSMKVFLFISKELLDYISFIASSSIYSI